MLYASQVGKLIFNQLESLIKPDITTNQLAKEAKKLISQNYLKSEFLGYHGFPGVICTSINDEICHGVPSDRQIKEGDLVSIDIGIRNKDKVVDACRTFEVGEMSEEAQNINYWTKIALMRAIRRIKAGREWSEIACVIENTAKSKGYAVIREITGHGIGNQLHEDPILRNYACKENKNIILQEGQTICVEPMFSAGNGEMEVAEDGWTIRTKDKSLSSHWEHCLRVTKEGCEIIL